MIIVAMDAAKGSRRKTGYCKTLARLVNGSPNEVVLVKIKFY